MCGICGKINFNLRPVDSELIRKMANALIHRGPDDEGLYIKDNVGLGHRRLSIIDLSSIAHQPMSNEDGSVWIVCNGEIYNFQELKKDLEERGHIFRSKSDTEVIIHLYEEKGIDCVKLLRGMFAFALWDEKKRRLFLARDRAGKKPLNYAITSDSFIFASEINSLLQDSQINRTINLSAIDAYLTYLYVPAPESIFSEIKKLPPAHILVLEEGKIKMEQYWSLSFQNTLKLKEEEYCERILGLLNEACKLRLISDVPLGAFLSGGIDSSAIVAIMSRISDKPVKTFSIGFTEQSFDELRYARRIAELFGTEHREYIVKADALEVLSRLIRNFGEPFGDSSAIPTYYLSKVTRESVTVALNGDGGDESFAGYERYAASKIADIYNIIPLYIRRVLATLTNKLTESTRKKDFIKYLKRFIKGGCFSKEARYAYWMSTFDNRSKNNLYSQDFKNRLSDFVAWDYIYEVFRHSDAKDLINTLLSVDVATYLPNDLLVKVDIAAMANSLEVRSPFLDHKLMEFAATIPSQLKLKGLVTKYILKKAFKGIIPTEILQRKKYGFGVPVGSWFRSGLKKFAYDTLLSRKCTGRGYFQEAVVKKMLDEHVQGKVDHGGRIWSLINLELWHQLFIDGQ